MSNWSKSRNFLSLVLDKEKNRSERRERDGPKKKLEKKIPFFYSSSLISSKKIKIKNHQVWKLHLFSFISKGFLIIELYYLLLSLSISWWVFFFFPPPPWKWRMNEVGVVLTWGILGMIWPSFFKWFDAGSSKSAVVADDRWIYMNSIQRKKLTF